MKLVTHLLSGMKESGSKLHALRKHRLFVLEEPTIGLHMADVHRLIEILQRLIDSGHSVIVIEHNMDLIAEADWIIDLGPDGGTQGGNLIAEGTPEKIAANRKSITGRYLKKLLA
jgi:excinuclease ABC subunit A